MTLACTLWDESDLNISTDGELLLDIIDETPYLCLLLSSHLIKYSDFKTYSAERLAIGNYDWCIWGTGFFQLSAVACPR